MIHSSLPPSHPLLRYFRGLTESTFYSELGLADPELVGYISDVLVRFVPQSQSERIRDEQGRSIDNPVDLLIAIEERGESSDTDRGESHRQVGDVLLFWTGIFPESLARRPQPDSAAPLVNLQQHGKRSYLLASTYLEQHSDVLRQLSDEFELCVYGLNRIRQEWQRGEGGGPEIMTGPIIA